MYVRMDISKLLVLIIEQPVNLALCLALDALELQGIVLSVCHSESGIQPIDAIVLQDIFRLICNASILFARLSLSVNLATSS